MLFFAIHEKASGMNALPQKTGECWRGLRCPFLRLCFVVGVSIARFHGVAFMKGTVILSHGLESGPEATKVTALAKVAEELGWASIRPDYRDLDAKRDLAAITDRTARAVAAAPAEGRVIFAGSSMGAFVSGFASMQRACEALFLMALPASVEGYEFDYKAAPVPTTLVHGWRDEICPVNAVIEFARERGDTLHLVDDEHRLSNHVDYCAEAFRQLLLKLES
jgi:alpha/beta superfamily hydrolase